MFMERVRIMITRILERIQYLFWWAKSWILENKKTFFTRVALAALAGGVIFWFFLRTYHDYDVVNEIERKSDTSANYYFAEDGILCYSKDGVSFTNTKGEVVWNQVFGMEAPKMHDCGDYIAIGDVGANSLYVFDHKGMEGKLTLDKPIQDLRISEQGIVAVVLSDDAANQINLYNKDGKILASIKATIATSGYPLTIALSEDGTHLVVSYVVFNGGKVHSRLVFYDFSNKETSGTPAGSYDYEELFPKVEFIDEKTVLACGESGFYTYQFKETVLEQGSQSYFAEAKSIFVTDKYIGIVMKNPEIPTEGETVDKYKVQIYRLTGRKAGEFTFDFDYKSVSASNDKVVFYNDYECEIYSYHGHKKFQHVFDRNIEKVLPADKAGQYILLDAQSVQTITLK